MKVYKKIITASFDRELWKNVDWYDEKQQGLGDKFLLDVYETMQLILKNPFAFRRSIKETRECLLAVFPYLIVYEIENQDTVVFYMLFPFKRNPRKKNKLTKHRRKK